MDFFIQNKEEIAGISSKILDGKKIMIMTGGRVEGEIPKSILISDITTCEEKSATKVVGEKKNRTIYLCRML